MQVLELPMDEISIWDEFEERLDFAMFFELDRTRFFQDEYEVKHPAYKEEEGAIILDFSGCEDYWRV